MRDLLAEDNTCVYPEASRAPRQGAQRSRTLRLVRRLTYPLTPLNAFLAFAPFSPFRLTPYSPLFALPFAVRPALLALPAFFPPLALSEAHEGVVRCAVEEVDQPLPQLEHPIHVHRPVPHACSGRVPEDMLLQYAHRARHLLDRDALPP